MAFNKKEFETIVKICERAEAMDLSAGQRITLIMDLENVHKNVGLNLEGLLAAEDFDFAHDVVGIQNHINRKTGELEDFFLPRYAKQPELDSVIDNAKVRAEEQNNNVSIDKTTEKEYE